MSRLPAIPPLPRAWPYDLRPQAAGGLVRQVMEIPGTQGTWRVMGPAGLKLEGDPGDLGEAFGRGGVRRLGDVVIRPYRRGGLLRHLNGRTYLSPGRFAREFLVHQALWVAGFPTVEPLGYAFRRRGFGVEGLYLTRLAPGEPWPRRWDLAVLPNLRKAIEALSAWRLHAPDLNATNVLAASGGEVILLDWDRAAWGRYDPSTDHRARLVRSLAKLGAPDAIRAEIAAWK